MKLWNWKGIVKCCNGKKGVSLSYISLVDKLYFRDRMEMSTPHPGFYVILSLYQHFSELYELHGSLTSYKFPPGCCKRNPGLRIKKQELHFLKRTRNMKTLHSLSINDSSSITTYNTVIWALWAWLSWTMTYEEQYLPWLFDCIAFNTFTCTGQFSLHLSFLSAYVKWDFWSLNILLIIVFSASMKIKLSIMSIIVRRRKEV